MSFLAPAVLIGLIALVVPVVIHLIQRERKQVVPFPSLMFLRRIPYQSVRRRRVRHWMLLLVRLAALMLIVLAFARPFVERPETAASASSGPREVVMLVDRSYSMSYGDRWDRARNAVRQTVQSLGRDDRATLVLFSTGAEVMVRSTGDRSRLASAMDTARVGSGTTRYGPSLRLAQSLLAESKLPRREVVLISDFQKLGWRKDDGLRLPDDVVLTPVPVGDRDTSNVTVTAATFQRTLFSGQERVTVTAVLVNRSARRVDDRPVSLEIDGRTLETRSVRIEPGASASVEFAPFTLWNPLTRGTVRAASDALAPDNAFHFVLSPSQPVPLLIVESPGARREASFYLRQALGIGDAPHFEAQVKSLQELSATDVDRVAVVVVNDVALTSGPLITRLRRLVEGGGGLLVALGERAAWPDAEVALLPGRPGAPVDRDTGRGAALTSLDRSHPVFELFKAPRSGDFSSARFFRYRALDVAGPARVLARFDDGSVALAERTVGQGRVLVWTSTLDSFWNDLALKAVFLPFVHQMARHLARYVEPSPWVPVGRVIDAAGATGRARVAQTPTGQRLSLAAGSGSLELAEQGFYEIRAPGDDRDVHVIAVNLDPGEADLTPLNPQELVGAVAGRAGAPGGVTQPELETEAEARRREVWWYLLLVGLLILAADTVLSNRLSRGARIG